MKKIALVLAIIIIIKLCTFSGSIYFTGGEGEYTFYLGSASSNCEFVTVSAGDAREYKKHLKNVKGESITTGDLNYVKAQLEKYKAELLFVENVDGIKIEYYYSPLISNGKKVKDKTVNLQFASSDKGLYTLATPMIFGGF